MKQIPLTRGKVALVDDQDYEWLNQHKWSAMQSSCRYTFYAVRCAVRRPKQKTELMHRLILRLRPGDNRQTDHIDGNGLNNQRSNLRCCTAAQNQQSRRNLGRGTSKYRGVCWHRGGQKWCSQIAVNRKRIYLGLFMSETDAARTYDEYALKHFGPFALTNEALKLLEGT